LFVELKLPPNTYSIFHDAVTLMEHLSGTFVKRIEVINEMYQAQRLNFNEKLARHIASFKITFPTVFGQVKGEGSGSAQSRYHLPAVRSFKDWNAHDGESGTKKFILDGLYDLKRQFLSDVGSIFNEDKFYDAWIMATDMHSKSDQFITEMCGWMDAFYFELRETSEATEEEAWELVSSCVKQIFEDLCRVRASAANASSEISPLSKCTTVLWALTQSQRVMKNFLDMRFRNHPSIAPVIILHVFKTCVSHIAYTNKVKSLEGRLAKIENNISGPKNTKKDAEGEKKKS
jgi:hypothetical protein